MKRYMPRYALAFVISTAASLASAQNPSEPVPAPVPVPEPAPVPVPAPVPDETGSYPELKWRDLHHHNRAIAFGTVILTANGGNPESWKQVRAYSWCTSEQGPSVPSLPDPQRPVPDNQFPGEGGDDTRDGDDDRSDDNLPTPGNNDCGWSVYYTTQYELVECSNGRAFIVRSGEGVDLLNAREGTVFNWSEGVYCDGEYRDHKSTASDLDALRPLDLKRLQRRSWR